MKNSIRAGWLVVVSLLVASHAMAAITLVLEPTFSGAKGGQGAAILDFMHVEISNHPDLQVVDRQTLRRVLDEHSLSQQALGDTSQTQRIGGLLGARYFVRAWMGQDGEKAYLMLRVVQVETTLVRTRVLPVEADASATEVAQALANELPALLQSMDEEIEPIAALPELPEIPADWIRPSVMVIIPETHISPQPLVDPAGETEIISLLLKAGFTVIDAGTIPGFDRQAGPGRLDASNLAKYAASRGANVLLYGEAISERATALGDFVGCRARMELKAIDTATERVLTIEREVSGSTDTSEAIAAKRAIEQAARYVGVRVIPALAKPNP